MSRNIFHSALLVEDELHLAQALKIAIKRLGIPSVHARTLAEARAACSKSEPEFILLDRHLPDGDGIELCRSLRKNGYEGVILMLTAMGETSDRIGGLTAGADDYLPKPFDWEELNARILALARRRKPPPGVKTDTWEQDEDRLRIRGPKGWVELTPLEFKLASHLIRAGGAIVSREELLKEVWGFTLLPKTRTVDHFLGRLRKYFEKDPDDPKHFQTVRGAGYKFTASPGSDQPDSP